MLSGRVSFKYGSKSLKLFSDFSVYIDASFGNCFTFNYNASKDIRSERAGSNYGKNLCICLN
jgi:hypothetical protein